MALLFLPLAAGMALLAWLPGIHLVALLLNMRLQGWLLMAQFWAALTRPKPPPTREVVPDDWFVSIQVPACNEPPEVLAATLRSLAGLSWPNYEVLVIDNNTCDEGLWRPIEALCAELGPRFRFFHVDRLAGAKAGALNWVRHHMNRRATHVLVVDADYQLQPDALERGLRHFTEITVGLVQFPQSYRNEGPANAGLALEYRHFFSSFMHLANQRDCVPATGTLCFFSTRALREMGDWDTQVVTEDAELGLRLTLAGWRCVYVDELIGHGLLPHDLESLKKQRWRWAFGNAQILKANWKRILFHPRLTWRQKTGFLTHLTAWFNFNLLPSLSLLVLAMLAALDRLTPLQVYLIVLSGFTLLVFALVKLAIFFLCLRRERYPLPAIGSAYLTHLGLGLIFATSWIKCLCNGRSQFVRTDKFLRQGITSRVRHLAIELLFGLAMLLSAAVLAGEGFLLGPVGALAMVVARFAILWVNRQVGATRRITESMAGSAVAVELAPAA